MHFAAAPYGLPCGAMSEQKPRVVAVGDQRNDIPLLRGAGLAVSMANGFPDVRAEADLVIGDHREDGLARWLHEVLR